MSGIYSIKWKLSVSFVALSLALMGLYIAMAKRTFEADKIYYIFESEQAQLEGLRNGINSQFERVLFDSRSILAAYDFNTGKLSALGENLFSEQTSLIGIQILDPATSKNVLKLEKITDIFHLDQAASAGEANARATASTPNSKSLEITNLGANRFLLSTLQKTQSGESLLLRIVVELGEVLPKAPTAHLVLSQQDHVMLESGDERAPASVIQDVIGDLGRDRAETTSIREVQGNEYLVSSVPLKYGGLRLSSVVDKNIALSTLQTLYSRSLIFLVFAGLSTILIAFLVASKLTSQLQVLTESAHKIGHGDFSMPPEVTSGDEVGILSRAFARMSIEIKRLLSETRDKARMEQELNTAKVVQENLFPKLSTFKSGTIEISGQFATSSECSGDWWFYFENKDDLFVFVADATGHGTPAALLTCAARSLFSQFEISSATLQEMATHWDRAIASCSNRTLFMTAFLVQVSKTTGLVRCLNASHELPFLITKRSGEYFCDSVMVKPGNRLGEYSGANWVEHTFTMQEGDRLVLFTDGLTSIPNEAGKELRERKLTKEMLAISEQNSVGAKQFCSQVYDVFENHRGAAPLIDDVTLVVLERHAA